ncbi:hypothetical protein [Gaopeijia maritima]|uniref:Metallothionein n=1 Tax=Gaopeijia maritima TaxID=3119007 RepID=A0ABU9E822_9BACT
MGQCTRCGNHYDKSFDIVMDGATHTFDSFECAIATLAPRCEHCETTVIGHGLEADGRIFCCDHCAEASGVEGLRDRV